MQHDGIIDRIVENAESAVAEGSADPVDRVISVMVSYFREETVILERIAKAVERNGGRSKREQVKAAALPTLGGGGLASLVVILNRILGG